MLRGGAFLGVIEVFAPVDLHVEAFALQIMDDGAGGFRGDGFLFQHLMVGRNQLSAVAGDVGTIYADLGGVGGYAGLGAAAGRNDVDAPADALA